MSISGKILQIAGNEQKVYEAGKKAEYDAFWDSFQANGTAQNYSYKFYLWTNGAYKPKYPIRSETYLTQTFAYSAITDIQVDVFAEGATMNSTFADCRSLERIPRLVVSKTTQYIATFRNNDKLTEVFFEGVIGQNGLNLQWSPLTHDSIMSIINSLADYSEDTSGTIWTVTIGETNRAKLTDGELAIAEMKGWEVA